MRPLPDENGAIWLDSTALSIANEVFTALGPEVSNPAARRAVLHHLVRARLSITRQFGRSTAEELEAIASRLHRVFDRKDAAAVERRQREHTFHPATEPCIPDELDLPGGELPADTAYDPVSVMIRRAAAPKGGGDVAAEKRLQRRRRAEAQEAVAA